MRIKPWFFLVAFFLSSTSAFSQAAANQQKRSDDLFIRGKLVVQNQHDFNERVEVRLEKSSAQAIQTTYTDTSGNFEFHNLAPGAYYIGVTMEGFEPVHQIVEIFNNFNNYSVTVFISKPTVEFRDKPTGVDAADPDIVDLSQMKENFPKKAVQDYEKALDEKQKGKLESAVKLLEEAIQIAPTFFHAHNNLGIVYQMLKRFPDAEREYKRSHELSTKTERPLVNLGSLYIEESKENRDKEAQGKLLDQALDSLEEAVKLNPRSAVGYFLLGQANYQSSFFEEAETAFKKTLDLDPHISSARLMLANVDVKLERWDDVLANIDAYLKENPKAADRPSVEQMRARIVKSMQTAK
jgi:tetratricopeptide (TPR) repeat protein